MELLGYVVSLFIAGVRGRALRALGGIGGWYYQRKCPWGAA